MCNRKSVAGVENWLRMGAAIPVHRNVVVDISYFNVFY